MVERPVVWITGASRGMGADTAVKFAEAGYDVAITARDQPALEETAKAARAAGARALPLASDLTDRNSIAAFADAAIAEFKRVDVVCNIGIYKGPAEQKLLMDTGLDDLTLVFQADAVAPVHLCQRAIPLMIKQGGGTIINMSSISVAMEPPGPIGKNGWSFAYVASKAGLDRLASIINVELGDKGVRAFNVEPGFVAYGERLEDTLKKYPGMAVSPPDAIGPAIVWLAREAAAAKFLSKRVNLPGLTHKQGLLKGWDGPGTMFASQAR